ncbi:MAG: ATP-binding protein, partial [Clostridia bacterium]
LCVNYLFTYPYFVFNISLSGYLLTFLTMLAVSLIVSVLTTRIKEQERIRLEAEKEKLRANLLRAVSHDLRTPLTSIVGSTGAILDNDLAPEKQRELIADANADAQWLLRMIENLLAITRIGGDSVPLHMETEVLEDVLAEAIITFHKHFSQVEVDMALGEDILLAEMDAVLIEQVVLNLLENAVYHGGHTTRICLSTAHEDGFVCVTVSDNGAGIPKEQLAHVFSGTLSRDMQHSADEQKHMGIGLSVCKSIIGAHGGSMTARNNAQGGASFTFTLLEKENAYGDQDPDR